MGMPLGNRCGKLSKSRIEQSTSFRVAVCAEICPNNNLQRRIVSMYKNNQQFTTGLLYCVEQVQVTSF
jgi:hypothetical protein